MGGFGTFMITVGVAVLIMIAVFLFYYLGSIANSVYDARISLRKEVEKEIEGIRNFVQKELHQRTTWLRAEVDQNQSAAQSAMEAKFEERFADLRKDVDRLMESVTALQEKTAATGLKRANSLDTAKAPEDSNASEPPASPSPIKPQDV